MLQTLTDIFLVLALIASAGALALSLKRDLMMFQQNSYRNDRYRAWMEQSKESSSFRRLFALLVFLFSIASFTKAIIALPIVAIYGFAAISSLVCAKYKKPLVFTPRAVRIYVVAIVLSLIVTVAVAWICFNGWRAALSAAAYAMVGCCAVSYWFIQLANFCLKPVQAAIDRGFYRDAQRILASMPDLKIIGITGSYGKTSTKHFLNAILSEEFEVVMTPGNFNTTLGVIRTVREYLKPYTQVFIVEMGAKQTGDIAEICDLVHPTMGIITAVGPQHLESFKTIENVRDTKFELADSIPEDGLVVVNDDFPMIAGRVVDNCKVLRYAVDNHDVADFHAIDINYSSTGTQFTIANSDGPVITLSTRLVGSCNVSNLMAAVILALKMGVSTETIRYAVERIEPVEHRLSMRRTPGGITILDDAYNSNPSGSAMALEVLSAMKQGRRIVITPGMIELGPDQERLNCEFGKKIALAVDIAIVVGHYNRDAILAGINQGEGSPEVHTVESFAEGQAYLNSIMRPGDTVLYENDLPDTFK